MPRTSTLDVSADPAAVAKSAGLRYVTDEQPGITRVRAGRGFAYRDARGRRVTDAATLRRITRLAIPPAWTNVWICPDPAGHLQATGRDARRRKQYRYHPDWRTVRDETKYERVLAFGKALPRIRRHVTRDLRRSGLGREKVLATVVRLLETTLVRVGNEEYARANDSFGLSTMRDRHVSVNHSTLHFEFRGKGGKKHEIDVHDPRLAHIVRRTQELPGQELFQYIDDTGARKRIGSEDVNDYLHAIAGDEFSAKDFRTWAGTVLAAIALRQFARFDTKAQAKKNLVTAIERVAKRLGNTPAICRKCYVHPAIVEGYLDGVTVTTLRKHAEQALRQDLPRLNPAEAAVLAFLQERLRRDRVGLASTSGAGHGRRRRRPKRRKVARPRRGLHAR